MLYEQDINQVIYVPSVQIGVLFIGQHLSVWVGWQSEQ